MPVSAEQIRQAAENLRSQVVRTPCLRSETLSKLSGANVYLKFENLQFTASFKERGAFTKLNSLSSAERAAGIIAMSAGNHAQGVAYHAQKLGIDSTIVMPEPTPYIKVKHTEAFGSKVVLKGETLADARQFAERIANDEGRILIHPYDDPAIIAGQGSIALEMLEDVNDLDTLIVPIGGGGLISGISIAAKDLNPSIDVFGAQAALFPTYYNLMKGKSSEPGGQTIAEGIAVKTPGQITSKIIKQNVRDILLADESAIEHAIALLLTIEKTVVEGAGAVGLAVLLDNAEQFSGRTIGIVLSGGNIDARLLSYVIQRELKREGRTLTVDIETNDRPGFLGQIASSVGDAGGNIIDVRHNRLLSDIPAKSAELKLIIETRDKHHSNTIVERLQREGYRLRSRD